ncbi:MAG TPA: ABC transporter substrate-binding protein [Candidatus Fraserbacteria bacterium]|nr:ABC transporter substrate-binding protein [Candidatus Fraserbacteria bacterium]
MAFIAGLTAGDWVTPAQAQQAEVSVLRVGTDVDAGTLDPRLEQDTTAYRVTNLIYDGLVQLDAKLQPQPDLAVSWKNPDPKTWIFQLRSGVKFQDGTPVTAEDVVYTFQTMLDPNFGAPHRGLYTPIEKVEAIDAHTVKFTLKQPYAPLLSYLDLGIVPKHVAEKEGQNFGSHPIGSGPFKLVRWDKASKIVLEANPDFWGGEPQFIKKIEVDVVPDNTARAQALEAGDLDLIQSPLSPQDVKRLAKDKRFTTVQMTGTGYTYLNFNTKDPILSDVKVRQALAMLVDQKTIVDQIYQGIDKAATSILLPGSWAYTDTIKQPSYDPQRAKALLAQEGWKDTNGDGILDKNGKKLSIVLSTHSEDPNRIQVVEYLQNIFKQNGIDSTVNISDWPSFIANVQDGKYQIALLGWLNLVDPDRAMYNQLHTGGGFNWGGYSNPQVDQLLDKGRTASSQDERAKAYREAAKIIAEEVPYYILTYQGYQVIYTTALKGFVPNSLGMLRSLVHASLGGP